MLGPREGLNPVHVSPVHWSSLALQDLGRNPLHPVAVWQDLPPPMK